MQEHIEGTFSSGGALSGKWKLDLLYCLAQSPARWSELVRRFDGAAPNVLTRQLRQLEKDGLVVRSVASSKPPQVVVYALSDDGRRLVPLLDALCAWDLKFRKSAAV